MISHTSNKIFGLQLGLNLQMNPTRWLSWDMFAKVGGMANHTEAKTLLRDFNNEVKLRDFHKQKERMGSFCGSCRSACHLLHPLAAISCRL